MKIVIFGGTTEAREISRTLAAEGAQVVVSVASAYGAGEQGYFQGITVLEGRKEIHEMRDLMRGADAVIDATHPFAVKVTENVRQAASLEGIHVLRLLRQEPALAPALRADGTRQVHMVQDTRQAARMTSEIAGDDGRVLLTTGSKDLANFTAQIAPEHLYVRVLPSAESIRLCQEAGIPHRNIIAIQGPFSQQMNEAMLREFDIDVMVTKQSGSAGGFPEKLGACEACQIPAVVIARPREEGLSYEDVLTKCRMLLAEEQPIPAEHATRCEER